MPSVFKPAFFSRLNLPSRRPILLTLVSGALLILFLSGAWVEMRRDAAGVGSRSPEPLKIYTSSPGIYELGASDLQQAGWQLPLVDLKALRLYYRGRLQPLWVEGQGSQLRLRFYAWGSDSAYSRENIYWLQAGNEEHQAQRDRGEITLPASEPLTPTQALPSGAYFAVQRFEENKIYNPQVEKGEHWLWLSLPAPRSQTVELPIDALAGGGRLRVEVWASTEAPLSPDHHVRLVLNGQVIAGEQWDGKGRHTLEASLPEGVLKEGTNQLQIEAVGDTGAMADITFLDWVELGYARYYTPRNDRLEFQSPGSQIALQGFSGPVRAWDITQPEAAVPVSLAAGDVFETQAGRRYLVVGPRGYLKPSRLAPAVLTPDLRPSKTGSPPLDAEYLAIGPSDLLAPLQPLLDWHTGQGLKAAGVPVEAIYDQFNAGFPEPEAIRAFLKYASSAGQIAPHYVLLVGDATYDPRGYVSPPEANRLPVFLVPTVYGGETASDMGFAVLQGETWPTDSGSSPAPDLAVGWWPARTPQQVSGLVVKTITYQQNQAADPAGRRVLAIADGQEPTFSQDARDFLDLFPDGYSSELFAPPAGESGASRQIVERLNQGDGLVAYFGHGSVNMWGKDRLFTTEDVASLRNSGHLPVVIHMTCLTGLFTHPKVESLAESMLWKENGGAVAVLAATSLTLPTDQSFLSRALVTALLSEPQPALGDALLQARRNVPLDGPGTRDVIQTFLLFGDPALHLHY